MSDQQQEGYSSDLGEFDLDGKMLKPAIVKCDIPKEMRDRAIKLAFEAMNKFSVERDISDYIKTAFDKEFQPVWQCVVGKDFAVSLSHESTNFVFFSIEKTFFLIFKL